MNEEHVNYITVTERYWLKNADDWQWSKLCDESKKIFVRCVPGCQLSRYIF